MRNQCVKGSGVKLILTIVPSIGNAETECGIILVQNSYQMAWEGGVHGLTEFRSLYENKLMF